MGTTRPPFADGLPLDSVFLSDQLSLAPDIRIASWREPVHRAARADAPRQASTDGDTPRPTSAMATLRSLESRAVRASTRDLHRIVATVSGGLPLLTGDDAEYARGLLLKLDRLVHEQLPTTSKPAHVGTGIDRSPEHLVMDEPLPGSGDVGAASHLLIHAPGDDGRGRRIHTFIRRICAPLRRLARARTPLALEIVDQRGHRVLALDDARPLVDVALPAGTYHVAMRLGGMRRGYTVALSQGASFDLYLRTTRERH